MPSLPSLSAIVEVVVPSTVRGGGIEPKSMDPAPQVGVVSKVELVPDLVTGT